MIDSAKQMYRDTGSIHPIIAMLYPAGMELVPLVGFDENEKIIVAKTIRKRNKERKPLALIVISLAHMLLIPKENRDEVYNEDGTLKIDVSAHEDTREVIIFQFETPLTAECIAIHVDSTGKKPLILDEMRKLSLASSIFKNLLMRPLSEN